MDKKTIQEERMKNYFISAAKEIIRAEGIRAVSARNVADRAGYSYATLYNYFKDVRDLIFTCIEDFMKECRDFVEEETSSVKPGAGRIAAVSRSYVKFFVQYPGIFDLMYMEKPLEISSSNIKVEELFMFFDSLTESDWQVMNKDRRKTGPLKQSREIHRLALHGLLLFSLNRARSIDYGKLMDEAADISRNLFR